MLQRVEQLHNLSLSKVGEGLTRTSGSHGLFCSLAASAWCWWRPCRRLSSWSGRQSGRGDESWTSIVLSLGVTSNSLWYICWLHLFRCDILIIENPFKFTTYLNVISLAKRCINLLYNCYSCMDLIIVFVGASAPPSVGLGLALCRCSLRVLCLVWV